MSDRRGPITLITSISDQRKRWKDLAYAWKAVALQAVHACSRCGSPALWRDSQRAVFWCEEHWKSHPPEETEGVGVASGAERAPWYVTLLKALDLEDEL
ncbi:MAG: hypothetical protein IID05_05705 [Gemmatimonadetes bacterium]|nr:hypothetical protein [Gemmatimonadota bacterium]